MKKFIIFAIVFGLYSISFCQDYSQEELSNKLKSSLRMKTTGKVLVGVGAVSFVGGVVFLIKGIQESEEYTDQFNQGNYDNLNDDGAASGRVASIFFIGGTALVGTGVTLWIIGGIKSNRYKRLLEESGNKLSLNINRRGVGLQFNF